MGSLPLLERTRKNYLGIEAVFLFYKFIFLLSFTKYKKLPQSVDVTFIG